MRPIRIWLAGWLRRILVGGVHGSRIDLHQLLSSEVRRPISPPGPPGVHGGLEGVSRSWISIPICGTQDSPSTFPETNGKYRT